MIAITSILNATTPLLLAREVTGFDSTATIPQDWMCSAYSGLSCTVNELLADSSAWKINDSLALSATETYSQQYPVLSCLSQPVGDHCTVQLSLIIVGVVIACNTIKLTCMLLMLLHQKSIPLVTIGDAIESFMLDEDHTTHNMCWANRTTFTSGLWEPSAKPYLRQRHLWFASASFRRWVICHVSSITTMSIAAVLLHLGLIELSDHPNAAFAASGFGKVNSNTMADWSFDGMSGLLLTALLANIPQCLLSSSSSLTMVSILVCYSRRNGAGTQTSAKLFAFRTQRVVNDQLIACNCHTGMAFL